MQDVSEYPDSMVRAAAKQYFITLRDKYLRQVDTTGKKKASHEKNKTGSRRNSQLSKKHEERTNPERIKTMANLLDTTPEVLLQYYPKGAMSSECSGPSDSEEGQKWREALGALGGQSIFEIPRMNFRAEWVCFKFYLSVFGWGLILGAIGRPALLGNRLFTPESVRVIEAQEQAGYVPALSRPCQHRTRWAT